MGVRGSNAPHAVEFVFPQALTVEAEESEDGIDREDEEKSAYMPRVITGFADDFRLAEHL